MSSTSLEFKILMAFSLCSYVSISNYIATFIHIYINLSSSISFISLLEFNCQSSYSYLLFVLVLSKYFYFLHILMIDNELVLKVNSRSFLQFTQNLYIFLSILLSLSLTTFLIARLNNFSSLLP